MEHEDPSRLSATEGIQALVKKAEENLSVLSSLVESAKSAAATAVENQAATLVAQTEAQAKLADIVTFSSQAQAARTQISDAQAVIASKSDHIQSAQEHADKVRAELDRTLTSATQEATDATGHKARAQSAADSAANLLAEVRTTKSASDTDAAAVLAARKISEDSAERTKVLADKAVTIESRIADYEKRLADLGMQCDERLKMIEDLLPGATAAGLASAFDSRRLAFLKPHSRWQWLFVGSVLSIIALAISGLWHVYNAGTPPTYDELVRLWLSRLPVAAALVWLALHSSHEAALAKRLEEDYGYKAAVATCLLGFQKQMTAVGQDVKADSPLGKLLDDTLKTISAPPGRIYDQHKLTVSPADQLNGVKKVVADAVAEKMTGATTAN